MPEASFSDCAFALSGRPESMKEKSPKKVAAVDFMKWRRFRVPHMFFMVFPPLVLYEKIAGKGATYALIVECHDIVDGKMCHHIVDKVL
jgi:hypothetical protein